MSDFVSTETKIMADLQPLAHFQGVGSYNGKILLDTSFYIWQY